MMLQRFSAVAVVVLGLAVVYLFVEMQSLRQSQIRAFAAQEAAETQLRIERASRKKRQAAPVQPSRPSVLGDITGQVVGPDSEPLSGVDVLVILKTWPGGRYRQEAFHATSDADGNFRLPKLVPEADIYAVQIAAVGDGYTFESSYQLKRDTAAKPADPVRLQLAPAKPLVLAILDADGQPVPNALIAPHQRLTADGEEHVVYFQASDPVQQTSDDQGRVRLGWFGAGDRAGLYVRLPGGDWQDRRLEIPETGDEPVIAVRTGSKG